MFSFLLFCLGIIIGLNFNFLEHYNTLQMNTNYRLPSKYEFKSVFPVISPHTIFINNVKVIILLSFGGVLTLGGLTILNIVFNGIILGVMAHAYLYLGSFRTFLLLILPHGIFEIPGLIIAGTAGFKIPYELLRFALGKKEETISKEDAKEFFKLVGISILLIFIAALIESTITIKIAERI
ncbi:stage II sporulation protein M [Thermococcus sp. MV5]|nr:stage II sporulation protein M [Thermococcus sp. MV5]